MQKKWAAMGLIPLLSVSCLSPQKKSNHESVDPSRQAASINPDPNSDRDVVNLEEILKSIGSNEEERDRNREEKLREYMLTQLRHFYLAQDLLNEFDRKLDLVYQQKLAAPDSDVNLEDLEKERTNLNVAWEFNEKNLQMVQDLYGRLLMEANAPDSPHQSQANKALQSFDHFFEETWNEDSWAAFSMMEDLEPVNQAFLEKKPDGQLPKFRRFLKITWKKRKEAIERHFKNFTTRKKRFVDHSFLKQWKNFETAHIPKQVDAAQGRAPQSDNLYPDPGGNGNITGNRFSPGVWAITLDDGPHPSHTQGMLDAISSAGMKATFFWLSKNIQAYPNLVKRAGDYGFRRGSHSFTHANLPKLGENGLNHEIGDAADAFAEVVGERPTFFRCPYGACGGNGSRIRKKIAERKMLHVFWNVDSLDWQDKNPNSIFARVRKQMEVNGHGIILFHDIHPQSVEAMKQVVAYIKSRPQLKTYTMDEIVKLETGKEYHSP